MDLFMLRLVNLIVTAHQQPQPQQQNNHNCSWVVVTAHQQPQPQQQTTITVVGLRRSNRCEPPPTTTGTQNYMIQQK